MMSAVARGRRAAAEPAVPGAAPAAGAEVAGTAGTEAPVADVAAAEAARGILPVGGVMSALVEEVRRERGVSAGEGGQRPRPGRRRPVVSGRLNIRLQFCTAVPAMPLP